MSHDKYHYVMSLVTGERRYFSTVEFHTFRFD